MGLSLLFQTWCVTHACRQCPTALWFLCVFTWVFAVLVGCCVCCFGHGARHTGAGSVSHNTMMSVCLGVCCKVLCLPFQTWCMTHEC